MDAIQEFYSNRENCIRELNKIRELFGSTKTTKKQWQIIFKVLGLMLFYCPKKLHYIVEATLMEATRREALILLHEIH